MKKYITLLLLFFCCSAAVQAQLSETMSTFRKACLTMREGYEKHDKYMLMDASEFFNSIECVPFLEYEIVSQMPEKVLAPPVMQFNAGYCDQLIVNEFKLVELDDLTVMRGTPEVQVLGASIKPHGKAVYSSEGCEECSLMVVSETGRPLKLTVSCDGKDYPAVVENDGTVNWVSWTLPDEMTRFTFTIENLSEQPASFVIAVE